ncbi:hypothetical protein M3Y99_00453700 [Aphelenchoides fujianensis]|nr:hypothetical protein M3Y99_00453700 [Aphelenchoides fujianensis]
MHKPKSSHKGGGRKAKDRKGRASNRDGDPKKKPADATAERKEDAPDQTMEGEILHLSDIEEPLVKKPEQKPAVDKPTIKDPVVEKPVEKPVEEPKKTPEVPLEPPTTPPAAPFAASKPNASKSTAKATRGSPGTQLVRVINQMLRSRPPPEEPKPLAPVEEVGKEANTKEVGAKEAGEERVEKEGGAEKPAEEAEAAVPESEVPEATPQKSDKPATEVAEPPPAAKPKDDEPPARKAERPNGAKEAGAKDVGSKRKPKSNEDRQTADFLRTDMQRFFRPDLTIRVRNREFTISKQQMARHSNYFARLTSGGLYLEREGGGKALETDDVVTERSTQNEHIVELLVECVRNGGVVPAAVARGSIRELVELAFMARKWEIGPMVNACERELIKTTTPKNVHDRLLIGRMLRFERLHQYALELFARNKPAGFRAEDEKFLASYADSFAIKELLLHTNAFR